MPIFSFFRNNRSQALRRISALENFVCKTCSFIKKNSIVGVLLRFLGHFTHIGGISVAYLSGTLELMAPRKLSSIEYPFFMFFSKFSLDVDLPVIQWEYPKRPKIKSLCYTIFNTLQLRLQILICSRNEGFSPRSSLQT